MGSGYFDYRDIELHISQNHHEAFQYRIGSVADTSPVGDFGPFGRKNGYIPLVGWCKVWCIYLVGRG